MLAICDAEKPIAVAGVMGGFDSGITNESSNVLLEVAYFNRQAIRQASLGLNLSTEASYRFERGVDIENLIRASNRATELICEYACGTAVEFTDVYAKKEEQSIVCAPDLSREVNRLTGLDVSHDDAERIVANLGIQKLNETDYLSPSWRHDITIPEDLVEEVARIKGYDTIGEELPPAPGAGEYHEREPRKRKLRTMFADLGFDEALSYSFVDSDESKRFTTISQLNKQELESVTINDPIIEGADMMRPTLLQGLVESVKTNFNHKIHNLRLFEIGRVFEGSDDVSGLPIERETISVVLTGRETFENIAAPGREYDYFDLKAAVENAANAIGTPGLVFRTSTEIAHLQQGQSAVVEYNGLVVGSAGKLSNEIAAGYKFKQPVFVGELDLESLLRIQAEVSTYSPLPSYPSIVRDISLVVSRETAFDDIISILSPGSFNYFESVNYVDTPGVSFAG
jgi:phenylalanyl-tRNA synthetase beta chain